MKACSAIFAIVLMTVGYGAWAAADKIAKQERQGATLIVTYEDGRVETNSLFLAMAPEVKRDLAKIEAEARMAKTLAAVIADTKSNIPEARDLSDAQVALLYLSQMRKSSAHLEKIAPTNTLEYLVGAGMREDMAATKGDRKE